MQPILRSRLTAARATAGATAGATAAATATAAAAAACLYLLAACSTSDRGTLAEERITHGDTLIVRSNGGSVWDTTATLTEEIRIGKLEGADYETFGFVGEPAPDHHGGVYIFDGTVPALRHFDSTGHYIATLGREGSGPGEYRDAAMGLHVLADGRVLLRDSRNSRINVYSHSGAPIDEWRVTGDLFTGNPMVVDTAGDVYVKFLAGETEANKDWPVAILHLSATGDVIDTIFPPQLPGKPPKGTGKFGVHERWEMSPLGYMVAGVNGSYSFELRKPDSSIVRVEKSYTPVDVLPQELAEYEAVNDWNRKYQGQFMTSEIPPVNEVKPAYENFDIGGDGQIWVKVHVPAVKVEGVEPLKLRSFAEPVPAITWLEPPTYDVFEPDGTYLGRVVLPAGMELKAHSGSEVWATGTGEMGEVYVVRYRLDSDP